jgi:hypothetical protein
MALEQLTKENSPRVLVLLYSDFSRSYRIGPAVVDVSIKHSCLGIWKATGLHMQEMSHTKLNHMSMQVQVIKLKTALQLIMRFADP